MNKFILFASLFIVISSLCANSTDIKKVDDCKNNPLSDEEKKSANACCFYTIKPKGGTETSICFPYQKDQVLELVKAGRKQNEKFEIDCASNWLSISLYLFALIFMI